MLRLVPVLLVLTALSVPQPVTKGTTSLPSAEFPSQDLTLGFALNEGLTRAQAAKLLREAPGTVETVRALVAAKDAAGALASLRVVLEQSPERLVDAVEAFGSDLPFELRGDSEAARRHQASMRLFLSEARNKLPSLPKEDAARAERMFIVFDEYLSRERHDWTQILTRFIDRYRGTAAALLTEVDVIISARFGQARFDALDAFAASHPGTVAAAKAVYMKGFDLHTINTLGNMFPRDADPIERFRRVEEIVRELQSGRYPASEWVDKAPSLISQFFISDSMKMSPESVEEMAVAFHRFAAANFVLSERWPPDRDGIGYLVTTKIGDLYARKGERVAGVERTLDALERTVSDPSGVRLLRGLFYLRAEREETSADRAARLDKARETLRSLAAAGTTINHRRALATLAALEFEEGRDAEARAALQQYVKAYPATSWTWVARIRIGQCEEAMGNSAAAAHAYLQAAQAHSDIPLARVLGAAYAARTFELTGDLDKALEQHQRALAGWDNAYGVGYTTHLRRRPIQDNPFAIPVDNFLVPKDSLAPRIAAFTRALATPGGAMVERSRALLDRSRYSEAAEELARMLKQYPRSPLATEARQMMHVAQVEAALQAADVQRLDADETKAIAMLDPLAKEPHDFGVTAAKIMRAALQLKRGEAAEAEAALGTALEEWHRRQPLKPPSTPLEQDVAAIRRTVFLPMGGEIYKGGGWNAFRWSASPPPYWLVNSQIPLKLHDGEVSKVTIAEPLPDAGKVLYFDTAQIALLQKMIVTLGGTKRREPRQIMETPNQPIGDSMQILSLWQKFFPARPGHWGGWELEAYPVITEVHFTNADRTKASAKVTIGYSGATVELEKEGGKWVARRLTNQWIT